MELGGKKSSGEENQKQNSENVKVELSEMGCENSLAGAESR